MHDEQLELDIAVPLFNNSRRGYKTSREARRRIRILQTTNFKMKALIAFAINKRRLMEKLKKTQWYSEYYSLSCKEDL